MSRIFLSHSSIDSSLAGTIKRGLEAQGYDVFLDFDIRKGLEAGQKWKEELYRQMKMCDALLILWSKESARSRWCTAEVTFADAQGKAIFPLSMDETKVDPVLLERQVLSIKPDAPDDDIAKVLSRLCSGLNQAGLDPLGMPARNSGGSPYPGLNAYNSEDEAWFCGRDQEISAGLQALNVHRMYGHPEGVIALSGPSGVGKSSLLRAGLIPKLRRDPSKWTVFSPFRPSKEPFTNFVNALRNGIGDSSTTLQRILDDLDALARRADKGDTPKNVSGLVLDLVRELRRVSDKENSTAIIAIDQMEELFHPQLAAIGSKFLAALLSAYQAAQPVSGATPEILIIGTIRSEYLDDLCTDPSMELFGVKPLPLLPMTLAGLRDAIRKPAARFAGVEVTPEVVETIVEEARGNYALPFVAFALEQLWTANPERQTLSLKDYHRLGGVRGSIAHVATEVLKTCGASVPKEALREAFLLMVSVDDDGRFARRKADWRLIPGPAKAVLEVFVEKRLLVTDQDQRGVTTIEVAHEALFTGWSDLNQWLQDAKSGIQLRRQLEQDSRDWIDKRGEPLLRWQRQRLIDGIHAANSPGTAHELRAFLHAAWSSEEERASSEQQSIRDRLDRLKHQEESVEFDDTYYEHERVDYYYDIERERDRLKQAEAEIGAWKNILDDQSATFREWSREHPFGRNITSCQAASR